MEIFYEFVEKFILIFSRVWTNMSAWVLIL